MELQSESNSNSDISFRRFIFSCRTEENDSPDEAQLLRTAFRLHLYGYTVVLATRTLLSIAYPLAVLLMFNPGCCRRDEYQISGYMLLWEIVEVCTLVTACVCGSVAILLLALSDCGKLQRKNHFLASCILLSCSIVFMDSPWLFILAVICFVAEQVIFYPMCKQSYLSILSSETRSLQISHSLLSTRILLKDTEQYENP